MNSIQNQRKTTLDKIAPVCAVLWLLYVMNTIFAWFSFSVVLRVLGVSGILAYSFLSKSHEVSKGRRIMAIFVFLYFIWALIKMGHFLAFVSISMTFIPVMCLLFWPTEMLKEVYDIFRKIVIFFAIGSAIITVLSYVGMISSIPHFEMPPQSPLHENRNDFYNVYFIFPELNMPDSFFHRACGMMEEPGHFSIVLGFVYLIDRYTHRKINPVIVLCAVLAFSSAFFLILFFTDFWNIIRYWKKALLYMSAAFLACIIIYQILPREKQDMVRFLAYERNLEQVTDAFNSSGSLNDALDERAGGLGNRVYDHMSFSQKLVGNEWDSDMVLSDYRGFIVRMGLIGFSLVIFISLTSLFGASFNLKISLFLTMLLIMLHRSWFFLEPFPYFMSFLASSLYKYNTFTPCKNH